MQNGGKQFFYQRPRVEALTQFRLVAQACRAMRRAPPRAACRLATAPAHVALGMELRVVRAQPDELVGNQLPSFARVPGARELDCVVERRRHGDRTRSTLISSGTSGAP